MSADELELSQQQAAVRSLIPENIKQNLYWYEALESCLLDIYA